LEHEYPLGARVVAQNVFTFGVAERILGETYAQADQRAAEPLPGAERTPPGRPRPRSHEILLVLHCQLLHLSGIDHASTVRLYADRFGPQ
jgi:hypothetical protein